MKNTKRGKKAEKTAQAPKSKGANGLIGWVSILVLIVLDLGSKTASQIADKLEEHITALTGNTNFPAASINPTLAALGSALISLRAAIVAAATGDRIKIEDRNRKQLLCEDLIRQLSYNILDISGGDIAKIESAAFRIRRRPSPPAPPAVVTGLKAKAMQVEGMVKLRWNRVVNKSAYVVEMATDPNGEWTVAQYCGKASLLLTDLTPGTRYYFRVYAFNTQGRGGTSGVENVHAPFTD